MRLHKLRRRQSHPLIERYIGEVVAFEDFEKAHRRGADILDIMAHGKGNETDIATKVEGARLTGSGEHAHARLALDVILPLVGVGMGDSIMLSDRQRFTSSAITPQFPRDRRSASPRSPKRIR